MSNHSNSDSRRANSATRLRNRSKEFRELRLLSAFCSDTSQQLQRCHRSIRQEEEYLAKSTQSVLTFKID